MSAAIPQLNGEEFIIELKKLFLDENITAFEREVKIMRMLQYRFEQEMSEKRKNLSFILPQSQLDMYGNINKCK